MPSQPQDSTPTFNAIKLAHLFSRSDLNSHLLVDVAGQGAPIANALAECGVPVIRVRKRVSGEQEVFVKQ